jgi:hypothetical protein
MEIRRWLRITFRLSIWCSATSKHGCGAVTTGVSRQHLQAYLNEYAFRFNRRFYPFNSFRSLLGIGGRAAGPTYDGLYSGEWQHPRCSRSSVA